MTMTKKMSDAVMLCYEDKLSDQEIAKEVGINPRTLANWKGREEFSEAIEHLAAISRHQAHKHLQNAAERAVHTLLALMEAGSEPVRLKACLEVIRLLRIGEAPPMPQQNDSADIAAFMKTVIEGQAEKLEEAPS